MNDPEFEKYPDEMMSRIKEFLEEDEEVKRLLDSDDYLAVDAKPLSNQRCFHDIFNAQCYVVDDQHITSDEGEDAVASLKESLVDWSWIYPDIGETEGLDGRQSLLVIAREIENLGVKGHYAVHEGEFTKSVLLSPDQ